MKTTNSLPSKNAAFLKSIIGKSIISVSRQIFTEDMDLEDFQQNADGPVEITLSNRTTIHFFADTDRFSVGVTVGRMPTYGDSYTPINVTNNSFWKTRANQEISSIKIHQLQNNDANYPNEFAIEFLFSNGQSAILEYIDEENFPDMLRVRDHLTTSAYDSVLLQ